MAKIAAYGTALTWNAVTVVAVRSLSGPALEGSTLDTTTHDSPNAIREFVASLINSGEISGEIVLDPNAASHIALWNDLISRTARTFTVVFPSGFTPLETITGTGLMQGFGPISASPDGIVSAPFTIKVSGTPVWS